MNLNKRTFRLALAGTLSVLFFAFDADAWMEEWAPEFAATPVEVQELSEPVVSNYVFSVRDDLTFSWQYCDGYTLDLNGDGIDDQVYIIPWMGNGLNASGNDVHFIVSNGAKGWRKTLIQGYGVNKRDFVKVEEKTYFRHSAFFNEFAKSKHNHWVFQVFSFDKKGVMRCSNKDFDKLFPAVTIFYISPRFWQIELTRRDLKKIAAETQPTSL